jgi:hypothetical protein
MSEENEPLIRSGREKWGGLGLEAVDDITSLDYVMLDFGDEYLVPRKDAQRDTMTGLRHPRLGKASGRDFGSFLLGRYQELYGA